MSITQPEDLQRLKMHLNTLEVSELRRLRECFEYEYSTEPENRVQIREILDSIEEILRVKL